MACFLYKIDHATSKKMFGIQVFVDLLTVPVVGDSVRMEKPFGHMALVNSKTDKRQYTQKKTK